MVLLYRTLFRRAFATASWMLCALDSAAPLLTFDTGVHPAQVLDEEILPVEVVGPSFRVGAQVTTPEPETKML